jgi:hypothetical protein
VRRAGAAAHGRDEDGGEVRRGPVRDVGDGHHAPARQPEQLAEHGVVEPVVVGQRGGDRLDPGAALVDDHRGGGVGGGGGQRVPARRCVGGNEHEVLRAVDEGRAGPGREVLERHDAGDDLDGHRRPSAPDGVRQRPERAVDAGVAEGDERDPLARVEVADHRLGGGVERRLPGVGRHLHDEADPLDLDAGGGLPDDGLGPADRHGGGRRGQHAVSADELVDRPAGDQPRVARTDADADEPGADRGRRRCRFGLPRRTAGGGLVGHEPLDRLADELRLGPARAARQQGEAVLQDLGQVHAGLPHPQAPPSPSRRTPDGECRAT